MIVTMADLNEVASSIKMKSLALRDQLRAAGYHKEADAYDEAYNAADDDGSNLAETTCLCCGESFSWDPDEHFHAPDFCSRRCEREMDAIMAENEADRRAEDRLLERMEREAIEAKK